MKTSTCRCFIKPKSTKRATIDIQQHKKTREDQSTLMGFTKAVNIIESKVFCYIESNLLSAKSGESKGSFKIVNTSFVNSVIAGLI